MKRHALACLAVFLTFGFSQAQTPEQKQATVAYVQSLQTAEGGFLPAQPKPGEKPLAPGLRASSSALRALKYFGGAPKNKDACAKFIESCFDKDSGGFADQPGGKPDVATTAIGLMAVVEVKGPVERYVEPVSKYLGEKAKTFDEIRIAAAAFEAVNKRPKEASQWLDLVAKMRNADGTYGKDGGNARDTGSAIVVVLRLGAEIANKPAVLKFLKAGQQADGGFAKPDARASDLETSYRITRGFHMLKEKPDVAKMRSFIATCRNADGGYGVAPGQPSSVSGTYYAGIILNWLSEA